MFECSDRFSNVTFNGSYSGGNTLTPTSKYTLFGFGCICLLGIAGNSISFYIFSQNKHARTSLFFILVLAVVDNVYLLSCFMYYPVREIMKQYNYVNLNEFRIVMKPILNTMQFMAIWTMVPLILDRYIAVCYPFKLQTLGSSQNKIIAIVLVCLSSVAVNVPTWFQLCIKYNYDKNADMMVKYSSSVDSDDYKIYELVLYVFLFLPTLVALLVFTCRIFIAFKKLNLPHQRGQNNSTVLILAVVILFCICQIPCAVYITVYYSINASWSDLRLWSMAYKTLLMVNSAVNFWVYLACNMRFRKLLMNCFPKCRSCRVNGSVSRGIQVMDLPIMPHNTKSSLT